MTVLTLRPNSTEQAPFWPVTGAGGDHDAAVADDSDFTYLTNSNSNGLLALGFPEPTVPAGAIIRTFAPRLRTAKGPQAGSPKFTVFYDPDDEPFPGAAYGNAIVIGWTTPTTVSMLSSPWSPGAAASLWIARSAASGVPVYLYAAYFDFVYVLKPTVDVTGPSGALTTTNKPTIVWDSVYDADGGTDTRYEVRVFNAAQHNAGGFDPATSPATVETSQTADVKAWELASTLPDGAYRAYVRVGQTIDGAPHWSAWDFTSFVIDVNLPAAPLIACEGDDENGRNVITVTAQAGDATTQALELQRSTDNGATWAPVRLLQEQITSALPIAMGTTLVAYDYDAANGSQVLYRARAAHEYSAAYAYSDWTADAAAMWKSRSWWIKSPSRPALNLKVRVHSQPGRTRATRAGVFQPLGAAHPVVVSDTRASPRGVLTLLVGTQEVQAKLDALLDLGTPLLVQAPRSDHWPDRHVVFEDQGSARIVDKGFIEATFETLPWIEVAAPDTLVVAWPVDPGGPALPLLLPHEFS